EFANSHQISDVDVDVSGRMYLAAWAGAGYSGNPGKGFVETVSPPGYKPIETPDFRKAPVASLVDMTGSKSAIIRLHAQQELLRRGAKDALPGLLQLAAKSSASPEARVSAIFTYAQLGEKAAIPGLVDLAK